MAERTAVVASKSGLHARPAGIFVEAVAAYDLDISIAKASAPEDRFDAASILSLMGLGAGQGETVVLRAEGDGAEDALDALAALLERDLDAD
ncbi:HPr family phosphocarrier protein [Sediminivirga luteola]|jgi:phosphocarrier protein|uniref:HPr domain-containing protein n=1 Tax=Sediminivirga luteola TaxID=1774748 RepID=A0A8J2XKG3_9MICO|nr:HPr family phosphocarrier protein [Sediminivirga luteola]MCI2266013.1 HPr family phosphocarrier protein [Sediminivirga luteola]GGA28030.1 hypothetical protein GCM10011333_33490 [Sediminivirga luteola]